MDIKKLSIIIPIYNEDHTLLEIIKRVESVKLGNVTKEIILIDDGSTDNTRNILRDLKRQKKYTILYHKQNMGKGYALRTGFKKATGDVIVTQDSDLEYHPNDIKLLLSTFKKQKAKVVYGSRLLSKRKIKHGGFTFYYGGRFINILTNILYGVKLTDEATGYKMFHKDIIDSVILDCKRFEFCPEITAKIAKRGIEIHEVPITYEGRSIAEGKKIRWKDGAEAIWTLVKYRFKN